MTDIRPVITFAKHEGGMPMPHLLDIQTRAFESLLVPDDVGTLFLFRPNALTDRDKYVLDQFVVRGGTLVVFASARNRS